MKLLVALLCLSLSAHAQLKPGETELKLPNGDLYQGIVKDGKPNGYGYMRFKNDTRYEGGFKDGLPHGAGALINAMGDTYEGQFENGLFDGRGKMVFRLGGSYEGQWKKGDFNGKGVMIYAGSGKRLEAEFINGLPAGTEAPAIEEKAYSMRGDEVGIGSHFASKVATGAPYPQDKPYQAMSPGEKAAMHQLYPGLAPGDEPPFPADGMKNVINYLSKAQQKVLDEGSLTVIIDVDAAGNPTKASMSGSANQDLIRFAATVLMQQKYKPAVCDGKPCAMPFYFAIAFTVSNIR